MRLYKPKYKDPTTGKTRERPRWWIETRDHLRRTKRFAGFADKAQTRVFGINIQKLIGCAGSGNPVGPELSAWVNAQPEKLRERFSAMGLISKRQATAAKSLESLLGDFKPTLLEGAGTPKQQRLVMSRLRRIVAGCKAGRWQDLTKRQVITFLDGLLGSGDISKRTYNFYVQHVRRFGKWLAKELLLAESPFEELTAKRFNKRRDQVHERRALTAAEARKLLATTKDEPKRYKLSGYQRYLCYKLAIESGLRCKEMRSLTPESLDFSACTVTVLGDKTKNQQDAVLPLRRGTAAEIKSYCRGFTQRARLFDIPHRSSDMIAADCKAADIDYVDQAGRYADFHALRHTCGTLLAAAGVHPKTCQQILRHKDIRLTLDYYTHFLTGQEHKAVESLPDLDSKKKRATGTDGK